MKVIIGNYRYHWISPYTIAQKICFWREIDYDEPWVKRFNRALEPVMSIFQRFLDTFHPRVHFVKIDKWDTWAMDGTLAKIILPMLIQLKETKHGYPSHLTEKKWDYILGEMIWTFEQIADDENDEQFWTRFGELDLSGLPDEDGLSEVKWKIEPTINWIGLEAHHARIDKGTALFGKYYRALWD